MSDTSTKSENPSQYHGARRSGRTTRMLRVAQRTLHPGRVVYVVGASAQHAQQLREQFEDMCTGLDIPMSSSSEIRFVSMYSPHIDWHRNSIYGADASPGMPRVFFDHFAVEQRIRDLTALIDSARKIERY